MNKDRDAAQDRRDHAGSRANAITNISDLMALYDEAFVKAAYVLLLGRQADPIGLAYYTARLRRGHCRISVIHQLSRSTEVREDWDKFPGLSHAIDRFVASRRISGWKLALRDPELGRTPALRRARVFENSIARQRQQIEQSITRLSVQQDILKGLVSGRGSEATASGVERPHRRVVITELPDLRPRRLTDVRDFDLPPSARSLLDAVRF